MKALLFIDRIEEKYRDAFSEKVRSIAEFIGLPDPNHLMLVMDNESGLNSKAVNKQKNEITGYDENGKLIKPKGTLDASDPFVRAKYRATGLIQFMPATAKSLGTSTQALYNMTPVEQLDYVQKYFAPNKGKLKNFQDLYLFAFYQAALGEKDDYRIGLEKGDAFAKKVATQNKGLDVDGDGYITVGDFKSFINKKYNFLIGLSLCYYYRKPIVKKLKQLF
jgi:hypothetical protein